MNKIVCNKCKVLLGNDNWFSYDKNAHSHVCKKCSRCLATERVRKWRERNKEFETPADRDKRNLSAKNRTRRNKEAVIRKYGGKCVCCSEDRIQFLTIDHVNGVGRKHRQELGFLNPAGFYCWLKKNDFPAEFQVLCFNCNCGKGSYGVCPHDEKKFKAILREKASVSRQTKSLQKLRFDVVQGYGGRCKICGETNSYFLTIHHVNGGGNKERQGQGSAKLYRQLRKMNYSNDDYRLLCYNCNCVLAFRNELFQFEKWL